MGCGARRLGCVPTPVGARDHHPGHHDLRVHRAPRRRQSPGDPRCALRCSCWRRRLEPAPLAAGTRTTWGRLRAAAGLASSMRAGVVTAGIALSVGVVAGRHCPTRASNSSILPSGTTDRRPVGSRVLSLRSVPALLDQTERELFSVGIDDPIDRHYRRQMALTEFNGRECGARAASTTPTVECRPTSPPPSTARPSDRRSRRRLSAASICRPPTRSRTS